MDTHDKNEKLRDREMEQPGAGIERGPSGSVVQGAADEPLPLCWVGAASVVVASCRAAEIPAEVSRLRRQPRTQKGSSRENGLGGWVG